MSDNMTPYSSGLDLVDERLADGQYLGHIRDPQLGASDPSNGTFIQFQIGGISRMFSRSYWNQMFGIDACGNSAQMMEMLPFWDGTNLSFVDDSMGWTVFPIQVHPGIVASRISWLPLVESASPDMTESRKTSVFFAPLIELVLAFQAPMNMARSKRGWLTTAAEAKRYVRQRVTSLVEVARKGLVERISTGPSFYLDATLKEVTQWL